MHTAFLWAVVMTGLSLFYTPWLPWSPLVILPLVTWLVYAYQHIPLEYYKNFMADYDPKEGITTIWVPKDDQNYSVYYVVHYLPVGDVCRVTTQNPLEDD